MSDDEVPNRRTRRQGCECGHPDDVNRVHAADHCRMKTVAERVRGVVTGAAPMLEREEHLPQGLRDTLADFAEEMRRIRNLADGPYHDGQYHDDQTRLQRVQADNWAALRSEALFGIPADPAPYPTPYPMGPDERLNRQDIARAFDVPEEMLGGGANDRTRALTPEQVERIRRAPLPGDPMVDVNRIRPNPESYNGDPPPRPRREPMDHEHNRVSQAQMDEAFADLESKSKGELLDLIRDMRQDWATLNDIHNRRAQRSGWCTEYEERQDRHNTSLKVFKLLGRHHGDPSDDYPDDQGGL